MERQHPLHAESHLDAGADASVDGWNRPTCAPCCEYRVMCFLQIDVWLSWPVPDADTLSQTVPEFAPVVRFF